MSKEKVPTDSEGLSDGLQRYPSGNGEIIDTSPHVEDAVFGEVSEGGPNYRNLGWIATIALMTKTQIGLGVLSIPATFDALGIVPGVILLMTVSAVTTWSDYIIGVFKRNHPEVYGIDDAGFKMFGRIGREVFATAFMLYWIFVSGSAMLGISIGLNAVSTHGACTAVFVAVAAIFTFMFSSIRTFGRISWVAWAGLTCIMTAIVAVTIAVGVQDRPADAPPEGQWVSDYKITNKPSFADGVSAVSALIFSFSGTPGFFSIAAEMREPRYYTRSLLICQSIVTGTYVTIGVVVYYYCGSYVASPALGSAGVTMKKVCYGIALPGLIVTAMIVTHIPAKYIFVRLLRGTKHLNSNSLVHWATWLACTAGVTIIAYIIASAIPVFGGLVSLIGALLGTFMCFQPYGCMWLYDNWATGKKVKSAKWCFMVGWCVFVIVIGTFVMVAGTYGSIVGIIDSYNASGGTAAWSCVDNSNSV
ncbi:transmembrane amino acid transporter protein-domain-containing protein [Thelonectria olida]|uniref:Transmembrane amino acid transporter protein-domain-containing protein n=1 Tax=Thelonectria olida TaxID=1576542 RepID=A0A9P9AKF1_9HYPO|nr:transmembrane amino acid transporter protein-domain-containing protein [Thelonectria olida]